MKMRILAAAIAALGVSASAQAAFGTIVVDPNGAAGGGPGAVSITSLNWLAGNALTLGALGITGDAVAALAGPRVLTTVYQAGLNTFVNNSGGGSTQYLAPGTSEWTVVATFQELAVGIGSATSAFIPLAGTVSIYYDPTKDSNDIFGTGYNGGGDAIEILRGTVVAGNGTYTDFTRLAPGAFPNVNLDNFGTDDAPGIVTHQGSGQNTLKVDIGATAGDFIDPNFFLTDITTLNFLMTGLEDANDTGQLVDPFNQANPSDLVNGVAPTYSAGGINGGDCASAAGVFTATCDFHFQTTNVTSFTSVAVPEPGTLAMLGLGLIGLGIAKRRRG